MNHKKVLGMLSVFLIGLTAMGIFMVSAMAFGNPQSVMDLVQVKLSNNDAFSSIRGVYGGAGLTMVIALIYLAVNDQKLGLAFMAILCGLYAISRIITLSVEGNLGAFGRQWLFIEAGMCLLALVVLSLRVRLERQ